MSIVAYILIGLVIGLAVMYFLTRVFKRDMEKSFSALSHEALLQNSEMLMRQANETLSRQTEVGIGDLNAKKALIDNTLESIKGDLQKIERLMVDTDTRREKSFGEVSAQLKMTAEQTGKLQTALSGNSSRGRLGEKIAEDVLRLADFKEGINFKKQLAQENNRPDFTFFLPNDLQVNMDVKFPLSSYYKYLEEANDGLRETHRQQFLKDVRQRIREVTTRNYINTQANTVDYVLVFIPNEQISCFIQENDPEVIDDAMKNRVVLCSPFTLYAVLAVIRQSVEEFNLKKTTSSILVCLGDFEKQWRLYQDTMSKLGQKLKEAADVYESLVSTRSNQLERPLKQIEELRGRQE